MSYHSDEVVLELHTNITDIILSWIKWKGRLHVSTAVSYGCWIRFSNKKTVGAARIQFNSKWILVWKAFHSSVRLYYVVILCFENILIYFCIVIEPRSIIYMHWYVLLKLWRIYYCLLTHTSSGSAFVLCLIR